MTEPLLSLVQPPERMAGAARGVGPAVLRCVLRLGAAAPGAATRGAWQDWFEGLVTDPYPPCAADRSSTDSPAESCNEAVDDTAALLQQLHRWCAAIQREQNVPVFGPAAVTAAPAPAAALAAQERTLLLPCRDETALRLTLEWAIGTMNLLSPGGELIDPGTAEHALVGLDTLRAKLRERATSATNTIHFLAAAHALGVAVTEVVGGLYQLGHGRGSRWLQSSVTDATPNLGVMVARRKNQTALVLRRAGLPVPQHKLVSDADAAVAAAQAFGRAVVIKPADQDQGRGVFTNLRNAAQVRRAWAAAREFSAQILVEVFHRGEDYRLSVVHGRVVKVMHRRPGAVQGDGLSDIAALVAAVQATPEHQRAFRRGGTWRLSLDAEAEELLVEQGLTAASIPAIGQSVLLRRKANISTGGTHRVLRLAEVHADNLRLAVRAAALLRLDFAGIDLISPDITRPWHETGAVICEVNAQPQLGYRDMPGLYAELLRELMRGAEPVAFQAVLVEPGAATRTGLWAELAAQWHCNGWSSTAGVWLDGHQIGWRARNSVAAAVMLLPERALTAALLVLDADDVLRHGLPVQRLHRLAWLRAPGEEGLPRSASVRAALELARAHAQGLVGLVVDGAVPVTGEATP